MTVSYNFFGGYILYACQTVGYPYSKILNLPEVSQYGNETIVHTITKNGWNHGQGS